MAEDDSFIREVNEELRSDQMKAIWSRYGVFIIGIAVLIVLGTAATRGYEWWQNSQASVSGDAFLNALTLAEDNKPDEAMAALEKLQADGYGSYPVLARMRAATLKAEQGEPNEAATELLAIGRDTSTPVAIRNAALLRAGYLLVDHGSYDEVADAVERLSVATSPMRHSAREALGLAAWKAGDLAKAKEWFELIAGDAATPGNIASRAQMMLDLIAANTAKS